MQLKSNGPQDNTPDSSSYYQADPGQMNGQQSYSQPQQPYGQQPQNPYGQQPYNPYGGQGQGYDPYNQVPGQNMNYGGNSYYNTADAYSNMNMTAQSAAQSFNPGGFAANAMGAVASTLNVNEVLTKSFLFMFIALLITAITALAVASSPSLVVAFWGGGRTPFILCCVVELALVFGCTSAISKDNVVLSGILFALFAVINGLTFSVIFLAFELSSIVTVFFITAAVFAIMTVIGATTKKDLTGWGPYLLAGLIGILIGSLVNIFIGSSTADFVITIIGVVVFVLYTVYDVNKIVKLSRQRVGLSTTALGFYGAMNLYLDFINLFLKLLRLLGKRK